MNDTPAFRSGFAAFLLRLHAALTGAVRECVNAANEPVPTWAWILWG